MWKNKELKKRSRQTLKANYWTIVCLCFILAFFGIITSFGSSLTEISAPSAILGEADEVEAVNDVDPNQTPSLITYLMDYANGDQQTEAIATELTNNFQGKGGMLYDLMYRVDLMVISHDALAKVLVGVGILVYLLYLIFGKNILRVGFARFLIETRVYSKTKFRRVFFLFKDGGVLHASYTMIMQALFLALMVLLPFVALAVTALLLLLFETWWILVIGALVVLALFALFLSQNYGLLLVPFILSENPLISRKEAFALSRRMMKGNRIHAIGLDLSFIGWILLSILTFGLLSAFFLTPYRQIAFSEMFMKLRTKAIEDNIEYSQNLQDTYLTAPPASLLKAEGVTVSEGTEIFPLEYPDMVPFKHSRLGDLLENLEPQRKYTLITYILFFFIFSFVGWCWEVGIHLVKDGIFVNRGTMFGPWLPIYGSGGVLIIFLLRRFAKKPAILFASTMVLCSVVEYFSSWFLETTKGMKWWDYSNYFFNLNGRICLEGALVFAIGGCIFVYLAGPMLDNLLAKVGMKQKIAASVILLMLFGADMFYSHFHPNAGKGITDYGADGRELYGITDIYKLPGFTERL